MMPDFTIFDGHRLVANGSKATVALEAKRLSDKGATAPVLIFDNSTGRSVDFDLRGTEEQVVARVSPAGLPGEADSAIATARGRGRPSQGVVGREVTLLPRHWEWLATQPGGASAALRRLVEDASRKSQPNDRQSQEALYRMMSALAGDLAGFEAASRALYARNDEAFAEAIAGWP